MYILVVLEKLYTLDSYLLGYHCDIHVSGQLCDYIISRTTMARTGLGP